MSAFLWTPNTKDRGGYNLYPIRSVGIWGFVLFFGVLVILTGNYKVHLNSNGHICHSLLRELEVGPKALGQAIVSYIAMGLQKI